MQQLTTGNIFKLWGFPGTLVKGLTHYGMVKTQPLREFFENYFGTYGYDFKRKVSLGGVNAENGNYEVFNETLSPEDKINSCMTSSAIPFVFES